MGPVGQERRDAVTGEHRGVSGDVARELGRQWGRRVTITMLSPAAVLDAVAREEAELGFVVPNPDRQFVGCTRPGLVFAQDGCRSSLAGSAFRSGQPSLRRQTLVVSAQQERCRDVEDAAGNLHTGLHLRRVLGGDPAQEAEAKALHTLNGARCAEDRVDGGEEHLRRAQVRKSELFHGGISLLIDPKSGLVMRLLC